MPPKTQLGLSQMIATVLSQNRPSGIADIFLMQDEMWNSMVTLGKARNIGRSPCACWGGLWGPVQIMWNAAP